jgi:hypothetical protein
MNTPIPIDEAAYTLSEAAEVTGWNVTTLRDYYTKGVFERGLDDQTSDKAGRASRISFRGVLRLAIAHGLWSIGISPRDAFFAAMKLTDLSNSPGDNQFSLSRAPGELFGEGYETLVLWRPGHGAAVVPVKYGPGVDIDELVRDPWDRAAPGPVAMVRVNDAWDSIQKKLEIRR